MITITAQDLDKHRPQGDPYDSDFTGRRVPMHGDWPAILLYFPVLVQHGSGPHTELFWHWIERHEDYYASLDTCPLCKAPMLLPRALGPMVGSPTLIVRKANQIRAQALAWAIDQWPSTPELEAIGRVFRRRNEANFWISLLVQGTLNKWIEDGVADELRLESADLAPITDQDLDFGQALM